VPANPSDAELEGAYLTLADLAHSGTEVTAQEARSTIQALINRKAYGAATTLDQLVSKRGSTGSRSNLNFDQPADHYVFDVTPFDWNISDAAGTIISVEQSGSRRVLVLGTDGRRRYQLVRKYLALAPGAYTLGYSMQGERESPAALRIAVYCAGSTVPLAASSSDALQGADFARRDLHFTVTAACPVVLLAFEAKPTERPVEAQFANLSLNSGAADVQRDDEASDEDTN
jgi:hypothetical protein